MTNPDFVPSEDVPDFPSSFQTEDGSANPFNSMTRADTFGIRPDLFFQLAETTPTRTEVDSMKQRAQQTEQSLNGRLDLLSPLQDYGSLYMPANRNFRGTGVLPFVVQLGPMQGCEQYLNGIRFLDKGLWDIRAQVTFSWIRFATSEGEVAVQVRNRQGQVFAEQRAKFSSAEVHTVSVVSSVVVPEPGYYVEVFVMVSAGNRAMYAGPAWSRLVAQHISRLSSGSWANGSGPSDVADSPPEA